MGIYRVVAVVGPTASGKTALGVALARTFNGEILSADSRQVYRGLDIGAGKDLNEYGTGSEGVGYHLIDVVDLDHEYSVFEYQRDFYAALNDVTARGKLPALVGGTGLYIEAALSEWRLIEVPVDEALRAELAKLPHADLVTRFAQLKPDLHNTTDLRDRNRLVRAIEIATHTRDMKPKPAPEMDKCILCVRLDSETLRRRIRARLKQRLDGGMIEEVEGLLARGVSREKLEFLGLEYRYVTRYLDGVIKNRNDLEQKLAAAIAEFAKKQRSWFRRMERKGARIHWIDEARFKVARRVVEAWLSGVPEK